MSNSVQTFMKSTLPPFHQKSYNIREQSNFVSTQPAQWELYFQCSFCDKLQFKESIYFFYFWKPGLAHPAVALMLHHKFLCCLMKDRSLWLVSRAFHACDDCLTWLRFNGNGFFK